MIDPARKRLSSNSSTESADEGDQLSPDSPDPYVNADGTPPLRIAGADACKGVGAWVSRYGTKHRPKRHHVPGTADGRVGRVTFYERNQNILLRWREDDLNRCATIRREEYENAMSEALIRATEINERVAKKRRHRRHAGVTIRAACESYLTECETSDSCCGNTIKKYRQELQRVIEFAEATEDGRRITTLGDIDTQWCQQFCLWLNSVQTTRNGGPVTERNPKRFLSDKQKQGIRQRFATVIDTAITHVPSLVPERFMNPMIKKLVGRQRKADHGLDDPPVSVDQLVRIVAVLDEYALAVLTPLFLFGPRPSELGRILRADHDASASILTMKSRRSTGYETKGRRDKKWPLRHAMLACIQPLLVRDSGPIFVKRWVFGGRKRPLLASADEAELQQEYADRRTKRAMELGRPPKKEELQRISEGVWSDAGAVDAKDILRELRRAAKRAKLKDCPTSIDIRHLFESVCEAARLSNGVIRHLMGHKPQRGDALHNYNHTPRQVLFDQVETLDEYRKPLIDALLKRASELHGHPR